MNAKSFELAACIHTVQISVRKSCSNENRLEVFYPVPKIKWNGSGGEQAWFGEEGALLPSFTQALRFELQGVALVG